MKNFISMIPRKHSRIGKLLDLRCLLDKDFEDVLYIIGGCVCVLFD